MSRLLALMAGWKGYAAVAALGLVAGASASWRVMAWRNDVQVAKAAVRTVAVVQRREQVTFDVGAKFETRRAKAGAETAKRQQEVPQHVTVQMDQDYPVPCGFVRVFNAATHGPIPDAAGCPDDAPSDVALSAVGQVETENAGQYDQVAEQLKALQDWVRQQQGIK